MKLRDSLAENKSIRLQAEDLEIAELQPSAAQRHRAAIVQQRRRPAKKK